MFNFLSKKFSGILSWVKDRGRLTEQNIQDALKQVQEALVEADVPYELVDDFLAQIKNDVVGKKIQSSLNPGQNFIKIVHEKLLDFLGGKNYQGFSAFQTPSVVMVMGLQGSGKTTTVAKLINFVLKDAQKKGKKRKILCASIDFYRPAAIEQLKILSEQVGVDFYINKTTEPLKEVEHIYEHFKKNGYELLFLDTAGRLHIDDQMMQELIEVNKKISPKYKFLVLDAMTGQESLKVAKAFEQSVGFNFVILSKMDSDARGGAAFAFRYALKKPISFVGCGEKIDDLESFIPERMASRILGMGDILSLIEKADEQIDQEDQACAAKKMLSGKFTLKDFAEQMKMMSKLGSLQKIASYMPGMGQVSPEMVEKGEKGMKKALAIISSMTEKERLSPEILNASRKTRIAGGAGVSVQDVNELLQKFEQSKQFAKMFNKMGKFGKFFK